MKILFAILAATAAPMLAAPMAIAQDHHGSSRPGDQDRRGPGGAMGQDNRGPMRPGDPTPERAMGYVMKAGASDLYEIQSSQIALRKSRNAQVRSLANMLITHHRMTTRDVTAAARRDRMRVMPPMLEPHQRAMIAELNRTSRGFDRAFLDQQRTAHAEARRLHMNYSERGDSPALRRAATAAVPIIQRHIMRIDAVRVR